MTYHWFYDTPEGFSRLNLSSDGTFLTGLWFSGSRDERKHAVPSEARELPVFRDTARWLDLYFSGVKPDFTPSFRIPGLTPFRAEVISAMEAIPFGSTTTYGQIARTIAERRQLPKMSARAVGGAVGWNPICIMIPCHRVIGADGSLTGYGGGIENKRWLLVHEGIL